MQIAVTKKLADAMEVKPLPADNSADPLFSWTATWTNTFSNRKEDMVVMINNATQFTVLIYGVRKNQFRDISKKMTDAIRDTFLAMNINPEVVDEYLKQAGEIQWCVNSDRKLTACMNSRGLDSARVIGNKVNKSQDKMKYNDTLGRLVSTLIVNYSNNSNDSYIPEEKMKTALIELTGKPLYKYPAFELLVTLDLCVYKATRRLIVPSDMLFSDFHKLLQKVFDWKNYHMYEFIILDSKGQKPVTHIVNDEESLDYLRNAVAEEGLKLSDYFPVNKYMKYIYDMGDYWEHKVKLIRVIEQHNEESPYLLEAVGQAPPEDVGGVGGFIEFREIMLNPKHPEYDEIKEWAGYWSTELSEWESRPRVIHVW